jgi:hypothetical protein
MIHLFRTFQKLFSGFALGALTLVLALGAVAPARATTISSGSITIGSGNPTVSITDGLVVSGTAVVNLVAGGSVTAPAGPAVLLNSGTLNVYGGSVTTSVTTGDFVSSGRAGVYVNGGTLNVYGGSIAGDVAVDVNAGTANIDGGFLSGDRGVGVGDPNRNVSGGTGGQVYITNGTIASTHFGVEGWGGTGTISGGSISSLITVAGTLSITGGTFGSADYIADTLNFSGCNLRLSGGRLTGTLENGQPINTSAASLTTSNTNLICTCCDISAPTTTAAAISGGNPYTAGAWTNQDVTVTLSATDPDGAADVSKITYSATGAQTIASTEAAGASATLPAITAEGITTVSFSAADQHGNGESPAQTFTVRIDKTAPAFQIGSPDGLWHAADVSIPVTASDAASGLANPADAGFSLTTSVPAGAEPSNAATNTRTVFDNAGNSATAGPVGGIMVDKKPPTITISSPANTLYLLNQAVAAGYSVTDGGSGVNASLSGGPAPSGSGIDTASAGAKTFTVTGVDNVGNAAPSQTVSYSVGYKAVPLYDQTKYARSGSTIPIKLQLVDYNGVNVSSAGIVVNAVSVTLSGAATSTTPEDSGNANPDNNFRYDAASNSYIYNLSTKGLAAGLYTLSFTAGSDPTPHTVSFQVK